MSSSVPIYPGINCGVSKPERPLFAHGISPCWPSWLRRSVTEYPPCGSGLFSNGGRSLLDKTRWRSTGGRHRPVAGAPRGKWDTLIRRRPNAVITRSNFLLAIFLLRVIRIPIVSQWAPRSFLSPDSPFSFYFRQECVSKDLTSKGMRSRVQPPLDPSRILCVYIYVRTSSLFSRWVGKDPFRESKGCVIYERGKGSLYRFPSEGN